MGFDVDDARLTAYALGELEPGERAEIEALLAGSEAARREVAEIRAVARELERELAAVPGNVLSATQRERIEVELAPAARAPRTAGRSAKPRRRRWPARVGLLAAASLAVVLLVPRLRESAFEAVGWTREDSTAPFTYTLFGEPSRSGGQYAGRLAASTAQGAPEPSSAALQGLSYLGGEAAPAPRGPVGGKQDVRSPANDSERLRRELEALGYTESEEPSSAESYDYLPENPFRLARDEPLSTFSIDVDTASYANVRRMLNEDRLPPPDAVRIEELVNYFPYDYPPPVGPEPFSVGVTVASAPWKPEHRLVRIALKGREISYRERRPSNLVFLLDVSGSMNSPHKLPLLKRAMGLLVEQLDQRDRVAIVVYAGASGLVLPSTPASSKPEILLALERLTAGGSTHGSAGIELAYETARAHFVPGGINRVLLCTDGDFNVGVSDRGSLVRLVQERAKSGVFLTVLGFGTGNLKDSQLEALADQGNGNYAYVDSDLEARKVLAEELGGTLITIAKDVKIQVEFNPAAVQAWRLIGYENRVLAHQDFNDDRKDAGDIGSGHRVTALYEVVPPGVALDVPGVDPLRYQAGGQPSFAAGAGELLHVKLRYKQPDGDTSALIEQPVVDAGLDFDDADADFRFAAAVAAFGMHLRGSQHDEDIALDAILDLAQRSLGADPGGYRQELLRLVLQARMLELRQQEAGRGQR